jgi:hypothetical protein
MVGLARLAAALVVGYALACGLAVLTAPAPRAERPFDCRGATYRECARAALGERR